MSDEFYVNKDDCTSCANCVDQLPEVFRLDDDGLSEVIPGAMASAEREAVEQVMEECSGACIEWK